MRNMKHQRDLIKSFHADPTYAWKVLGHNLDISKRKTWRSEYEYGQNSLSNKEEP